MRILLVLTVLLGSITVGCQTSDVTSTPQTGDASPTANTSTSEPTIAQTPQPSSKSEPQLSAPASPARDKVAAIQNRAAESKQMCQISAYVIDKDPKGLNVRSAPGSSSEIIGNLSTTPIAVIVDVTASQGDWVQLSKAQSPEKIEFQGSGWVYTQLLGTSTRGYGSKGVSVYTNPDPQSSAIGRIPASTGVKLLGCEQSWALVEYKDLKGWIARDAQCPNPLTTCP